MCLSNDLHIPFTNLCNEIWQSQILIVHLYSTGKKHLLAEFPRKKRIPYAASDLQLLSGVASLWGPAHGGANEAVSLTSEPTLHLFRSMFPQIINKG